MQSFLIILLFISLFFCITLSEMVYNIFWLVIIYILSAIILVILGNKYLPLLLILIYVGAITILFLFTIQMVDVYNKLNIIQISILFFLCFFIKKQSIFYPKLNFYNDSFIYFFGNVFFNNFILIILLTMILLIGLIGVLFLLIENSISKKQNSLQQIKRNILN